MNTENYTLEELDTDIEAAENDMYKNDINKKVKAATRRRKTYFKAKAKKNTDKESSDILIRKRDSIEEIPVHMYAKNNKFGSKKEKLKNDRKDKDHASHSVKKELAKTDHKLNDFVE